MTNKVEMADNQAGLVVSSEGDIQILIPKSAVPKDNNVPAYILLVTSIAMRMSEDPAWCQEQIDWLLKQEAEQTPKIDPAKLN